MKMKDLVFQIEKSGGVQSTAQIFRMKNFWALLVLVLLFVLLFPGDALAQKQDPRWFGPFQLSTEGVNVVGRPVSTSDPYGFTHVFWTERDALEDRFVIQYARFDGTTWSNPVDIYLSPIGGTMGFLFDPVITPNGIIHLFWTPAEIGPLYHISAASGEGLNARNWTRHSIIRVGAFKVSAVADSRGVIHLMVSNLFGQNPGLYYLFSDETGEDFSSPIWIDTDIPQDFGASTVHMRLDPATDIIHAVWRYEVFASGGSFTGAQVSYIRSTDLGATWSDIKVIDVNDDEPSELRADGLLLGVSNNQVHVVWSGISSTHREHMYSLDGGETWRGPLRIFGDLHGGAGDSMVTDGQGDIHFMGQIRYPQALYDIAWDGEKWGFPGLIYLINDVLVQIHIHNVTTSVRRGNQLVTVFTNSPADPAIRLYAMHRNLENIPPDEIEPTPAPTATPTPPATATVMVDLGPPTPTTLPFSTSVPTSEVTPGLDLGLSIAAVIFVMVMIVVFRLIFIGRR